MMPTVTAIVPIREQSTRLPNKNVRTFCGQPLFYWVLSSLHEATRVDRVVVDTDSTRIETLVLRHFPRVTLLRRPDHLIADHVVANQLIEWELTQLGGEHFLQTHVTCPLLTTETIDHAVDRYFHGLANFDSLLGVTEHRMWLYDARGKALNHDPYRLQQHQDDNPLFADNSTLYLFSRDSFRATGSRIGHRPQLLPTKQIESFDIDTFDDFEIAEAVMERRLRNQEAAHATA